MINAIESLTKTQTANVSINGEKDSYVPNTIKYLKDIFQGDSLIVKSNVIPFEQTKGYLWEK